MPRSGPRGSDREAARRAGRRAAATPHESRVAVTAEDLFARLRQGARNVAGVTYQVGLSAAMLVRAGIQDWPDVTAVRPEGFEDIDCRLSDGSWLFVQSKERSRSNPLGAVELAAVIAHALELRSTGQPPRVAVVTNELFASNVPATGWGGNLSGESNVDDIRSALTARGMNDIEVENALSATSTVIVSAPLKPGIVRGVVDGYGAAETVAVTVHAHLVHELGQMAGGQRSQSLHDALVFERTGVDRLVEEVQRATDLTRLSRAVDAGVCESADLSHGTSDDSATFFAGVAVLPSHIASRLDVLRQSETEHALAALTRSRQALIVGPSGTGKSALLWRTASLISDGSRVIRVVRVSSDADVTLLVDHVAALVPQSTRPVMVCVDDLGRARTAAWPAARDELLGMTGVSILGACRQEDLTPEIGRRAALVDSRLTRESGQLVIERLQESGLALVVEPEEAIERGDGYMMEMIAFATTGHHLREVLTEQVASLSTRDPLALEALRNIATLHTLGHALPAEDLVTMCSEEGDLSWSLRLLQDEHLIAIDDATAWRALHDLRAEVLVEVLHESPPPTLGATYARAIAAVNTRLRPELTRRAAIRLTRRSSSAAGLGREFAALGEMIREQIRQDLERPTTSTARSVAEWLQVAERLDALSYVNVALPMVSSSVSDTADPTDFLLLAYTQQATDMFSGLERLQNIQDLAARLPRWSDNSIQAALVAVDPVAAAQALVAADVESSIALTEAIEGRVQISAADVSRILDAHPVEPSDLRSVGLRAQLVAALHAAHAPTHEEAERLFGPVEERALLAVAADSNSFEVAVSTTAAAALPESVSTLARPPRSDPAYVAEAKAFARTESVDDHDPYPDQPGADPASINSQAVRFVRRLFDMCPELELVTVDVVQADGGLAMMGVHSDGHKVIRAGVIPRAVEQRRNIAVQAAAMSLRNNERWSDRCRVQAALAEEVIALIDELPRRFAPNDNAGRRRDWSARVRHAAAQTARIPGIPAPRPFLDEAVPLLGSNAADLEQRIRESDRARKFFDGVTGSLLQIVQNDFEHNATHGAGLRLADTPKVFDAATVQPQLPSYAAVGPTLPAALRSAALAASRLLTVFERLPRSAFRANAIADESLSAELAQIARQQAAATGDAVQARLREVGVTQVETAMYEISDPVPAWNYFGVSIIVAVADWADAQRALMDWTPDERAAAGFDSQVIASARDGNLSIPFGIVLFGASSRGVPAIDQYLQLARSAHGLQDIPREYRATMSDYVDQLVSISNKKNVRMHRPAQWPRGADPNPLPAALTTVVGDPPAWVAAVERSAILADQVGADDARGAQLVVDLAHLDLHEIDVVPGPLAGIMIETGLLALEADIAVAQSS